MPSLTLKNLSDDLLERLRARARRERRSLNGEAVLLLEQALAPDGRPSAASAIAAEREAQLAAWERLGGRWPDGDAALAALAADILDARTEGREVEL
jgi:plasmid stability protein